MAVAVAAENETAMPCCGNNTANAKQKLVSAYSPQIIARSRVAANAGPEARCENTDNTMVITGKTANMPLHEGPMAAASEVTASVTAAPASMRSGNSHLGKAAVNIGVEIRGNNFGAMTRANSAMASETKLVSVSRVSSSAAQHQLARPESRESAGDLRAEARAAGTE